LLIALAVAVLIYHFFKIDALQFLKRYHLAIYVMSSVVVVIPIGCLLAMSGDIDIFMDGFKTFPMLSPLLCFTAPSLWRESIQKLGVQPANMRLITILLVVSGFLFLGSFLLYWTGKALLPPATTSSGLVGTDGSPLSRSHQRRNNWLVGSAVLTGLRLPVFVTAILELAHSILFT